MTWRSRAGTAREGRRHLAAALAAIRLGLCLVLLAPAAAEAYWRTSGSGTATGSLSTFSAPGVTVPATAGASVPVSWTAAQLSPANATLAAQVTYAVQRSADAGATWSAAAGTCAGTLAAATTSCSDSPPSPGGYVYRVTATMRTWTAGGTSGTVSANTLTAPALTAKPSSASANAAPSFTFSGGGGSGYQCRLDAQAFAGCSAPQSYSSLADGSHTFTVHAVSGTYTGPDTAYTWTIDSSAPSLTSTPVNPSASTSASFSFTHARYASFQCQLDAGGYSACTSPKAYSALAAGSHTVQIRALDADGVATKVASSTWTVNTTGPTLTSKPANPSSVGTATFAFTDTGFSAFACKLDGGAFTACNSGTVSYSGVANGSHTFTVHALDAASAATADTVYTWSVTAPTLTVGSCTVSSRKATIPGTTTNASGTVTVKVTNSGGTQVASATTSTFTGTSSPFGWTVTTAALASGATYTATATQVDGSGRTSTNSPSCTFTV
jgi:hypothetical protein